VIGPFATALAVLGSLLLVLVSGHGHPDEVEVVPGAVMTQGFGCTDLSFEPENPACAGGHFHSGVDLAAPAGTPVRTPADGTASAGDGGPCGIHVTVIHGGGMATLYCHLSEASVHSGQFVNAGDRIGSIGSTGNSTGPHLHLEVHAQGRPVDPAAWLRRVPAPSSEVFRGGR
jgi:murein DD-endopeptidase MepM/ murein hydrolase activator NlpD